MTLIKRTDAPVFDIPGAIFRAYAAPSRGASEISLWRVELEAGSSSPLHELDCEEVFLGLEGSAVATFDGAEHAIGPGDCLIVPPHTPFTLGASGDRPLVALACMRAGGLATMVPDGPTLAPPWAA